MQGLFTSRSRFGTIWAGEFQKPSLTTRFAFQQPVSLFHSSAVALMPGFKKPSLRIRRNRWKTQSLEPVRAFSICAGCGEPVRMHHVCPHCKTDWHETKEKQGKEYLQRKQERNQKIRTLKTEIRKSIETNPIDLTEVTEPIELKERIVQIIKRKYPNKKDLLTSVLQVEKQPEEMVAIKRLQKLKESDVKRKRAKQLTAASQKRKKEKQAARKTTKKESQSSTNEPKPIKQQDKSKQATPPPPPPKQTTSPPPKPTDKSTKTAGK